MATSVANRNARWVRRMGVWGCVGRDAGAGSGCVETAVCGRDATNTIASARPHSGPGNVCSHSDLIATDTRHARMYMYNHVCVQVVYYMHVHVHVVYK